MNRNRPIRITFDEIAIHLFYRPFFKEKEMWTLLWADVDRIGYETTTNFVDDYFLTFRDKNQPPRYYRVPLDSAVAGALELADHVERLPGTKLPAEGRLANCIDNKAVTIWPAEKSGEPLTVC